MSDNHTGLPHDLPEYVPNVPLTHASVDPKAQAWADKFQDMFLAAQGEGYMLWITDDAACRCEWAQIRVGTDEDPGSGGALVLEWRRPR